MYFCPLFDFEDIFSLCVIVLCNLRNFISQSPKMVLNRCSISIFFEQFNVLYVLSIEVEENNLVNSQICNNRLFNPLAIKTLFELKHVLMTSTCSNCYNDFNSI